MILLKRGLWVLLALVLSGAGHPLLAQRGRGGPGLGLNGFGPRLGENVQLALDHQAELGLTAGQIQALEELGEGIRQDVAPLALEMEELRLGILTGEMDQIQGLNRLQEVQAEYLLAADPYRTRIASVLSSTQHRSLQQMMLATRPMGGWGTGSPALGRGGIGAGVGRGLGRGLGPGRSVGRGVGLGVGRGLGPGRGAALGLGQGAGLGVGRGAGLGVGRGAALGLGRGAGLGVGRGLGPGLGRGAGLGVGRGLRPGGRWR